MTPGAGDDRVLVERLFPGLSVETFEPLGEGWAYDTYAVNGEWVFQLPRLPGEEASLRRQVRLLPELAHEVSAPIPAPEFVSDEPPCIGYRKIEGEPIGPATSDGIWPERLGRFFYDLHMVPPEFVGMRSRTAASVREAMFAELDALCHAVFPLLAHEERARASRRIDAYLDDDENFKFSTCLTHGDVGPAHVLVSEGGDLAGVIDWGDASVGDPAWDFTWILGAMPQAGERALGAYGGAPDDRFRERCDFGFAMMPWHEVTYGVVTGRRAFVDRALVEVRDRL